MVASVYPNYVAGQRLTAASLQAGQSLVVYKTANTDKASTVAFGDDPELTFSLAANAVYIIEFFLFYAGNIGKMQTRWTVPAGVTSANRSALGPGSTATGGTGNNADNISMRAGVHGYTTSVLYGNRTTGGATPSLNQLIAVETSLVITTTAGTCAISWTQGVSDANTTRMSAGSWARALRIS